MRRTFFLVLVALLTIPVFSQRNVDYGASIGVSTYLGDINKGNLLYNPGPAGQLFVRYNFNPRQAIRLNLLAGYLRANDLDFNNQIQQLRAQSFKTAVGEVGLNYEFNFFPYSTEMSRKIDYTPYLATGIALSAVGTNGFALFPSVPFSVGMKVNVYRNIGIEAEYGFRKTFYDNFDGLKDNIDPKDYTWTHNNDWYTFFGVGITWKMYNRNAGCPAFKDKKEKNDKRKR
jgi:hypothetical protein